MRFFKYYRQGSSFFRSIQMMQKRELKQFNPVIDEVLIANFSGVFGALSSLQTHGREAHPYLTCIVPEFWMNEAHPYYFKARFGQTPEGFPKIVRDLFKQLYPDHSSHEYVRWEQVLALRACALNKLASYNVPIFFGTPKCIQLKNSSFHITIEGKDNLSLIKPSNTHFYFWYHQPKRIFIGDILQQDATNLYKKSPDDLPPDCHVFVVGCGLSVVWLARHFAQKGGSRFIFCIKRKQDTLNTSIPSNKDVDYSRIKFLDINDINISFSKTDPGFAEIYSAEDKKQYKGVFVTAVGIETPYDLVQDVPETQLTSEKHWNSSLWVAPKNTPPGSLAERMSMYYSICNFEASEVRFYHENQDDLFSYMRKYFPKDLGLDERYFKALKQKILQQDNPESSDLFFLLNIYENIYQPTQNQKNMFYKETFDLLNNQSNRQKNQSLEELSSDCEFYF